MAKRGLYISAFIIFLIGVISCEKDFTDVNSSLISNTKFDIGSEVFEVEVSNKEITSVRADGLSLTGGALGEYLLGVYNNDKYEKIEASMVSRLTIESDIKLLEEIYPDVEINITVDTAYLKLPYHATLKASTANEFTLDSIIGDQTKAFNVNIFQIDTYLSELNPVDPSKTNNYLSNASYDKIGANLVAEPNYKFIPNKNDTVAYIKRRLSTGPIYDTDTIKLTNKNPFARIPLNEDEIKRLFIDKYESPELSSQNAFDNYFRGLYVEASGEEGSLISFDLTNSVADLKPSVEIYYTGTIIRDGVVVDTIKRSNTFLLSNFSTNVYKMNDRTYPVNKNVVIQGAAGSMAQVKLFGEDADGNGIADKIEELRAKNWLVNDASLTFYVDQEIVEYDTISTPFKLFLFKDTDNNPIQIKDLITEGPSIYGGDLKLIDKKPNKYTFRITDYVSDILSGKSDKNPVLGLKVYNSSDLPTTQTDTIVRPYGWNPKAVTLLNHFIENGDRRTQLKISYTIRKE